MSPPGGTAATAQGRASCTTKSAPPEDRDLEDFLVAAHRLRAKGWTEAATLAFFSDMERQSRQRVGRRIRRMSDLELHRRSIAYQRRASRTAQATPRGDLITIRSAPRWPWRVSTS